MKKFLTLFFGAAAVLSAAGPLGAATQITGVYVNPSFACPGQSVAVSVTYCESQPNTDSYFLAALEQAGVTLLQPCPSSGQVFVVDSNGSGVSDSNPTGGWTGHVQMPVSACYGVLWTIQVPSNAVPDGIYEFVVAGQSGGISCGGGADSQMAVPITLCGTQVPTATPVPSGTSLPVTVTPAATATRTLIPTATPSATAAVCFSCTATPFGPTASPTRTTTAVPSFTSTPPPSDTPTPSPTPAGTGVPYANPVSAVGAALGCSTAAVEAVRELDLDPQTSYILMRLTVLCGCTPAEILSLRLTMGWDEICRHYGIDWASFAGDLQARVDNLAPEIVTPNQIMRAAANDPAAFPISDPAPSMPDTLTLGRAYREVCPLCK